MDLNIELINGLMFGLESVSNVEEVDPDLAWVVVFDCFLVRFSLIKWKQA